MFRRKNIALSDEELVHELRKGEMRVLGELWERYAHLLYGVAMKYLKDPERARDVVSDLFTTLKDRLQQHEVKCFRPWIHVVMRNECLLSLRREKRNSLPEIGHGDLNDADDTWEHEHELQRLEQAVHTLRTEQRICITMFYLERNSYLEVAQRTGMTLDQVRSHIQNGRRNLRIQLEPKLRRHAS